MVTICVPSEKNRQAQNHENILANSESANNLNTGKLLSDVSTTKKVPILTEMQQQKRV